MSTMDTKTAADAKQTVLYCRILAIPTTNVLGEKNIFFNYYNVLSIAITDDRYTAVGFS